MKLQDNTVFANRYELLRLLGRGGFSEVWLAKDQWTHLNVAIKVYAPGQGMEEDGMNEFCGELAGIYDINHSNLLKPQHVDSWENMPYLIMAYCPNGSCAKLVGKATEEQMWRIIHDVASGLAYLHEKGVVHQDIKPANILIDEDGDYLITDFGVSSRARSTLRKSVVSSTDGGTTAYMGPERFSKQPAPTKASDIWSFGAMCFELIEGDVPFGDNGGLSQRLSAEILTINANVSDALKFTIIKMLQKETWDRPTAATLVEWAAKPAGIVVDRSLIYDEEVKPQVTTETGRATVRRERIPVEEPVTDIKPTQNESEKTNSKISFPKYVSVMMKASFGVNAFLTLFFLGISFIYNVQDFPENSNSIWYYIYKQIDIVAYGAVSNLVLGILLLLLVRRRTQNMFVAYSVLAIYSDLLNILLIMAYVTDTVFWFVLILPLIATIPLLVAFYRMDRRKIFK